MQSHIQSAIRRPLLAITVALFACAAAAQSNPNQRGPDPTVASLEASAGPYAVATSKITAPVSYGGGTVYYPTSTSDTSFGVVVFAPGFLIPLLLCTVGVFFVRWVMTPSELSTAITLPIPDWLNRIIFGRGKLANPIVYSSVIPFVLSLIAIKVKSMRAVVGGIALGFAGILAYSAWAHAPALAWLPFTFLAIPWLVVNVIVCLFIARAMLKKEKA